MPDNLPHSGIQNKEHRLMLHQPTEAYVAQYGQPVRDVLSKEEARRLLDSYTVKSNRNMDLVMRRDNARREYERLDREVNQNNAEMKAIDGIFDAAGLELEPIPPKEIQMRRDLEREYAERVMPTPAPQADYLKAEKVCPTKDYPAKPPKN